MASKITRWKTLKTIYVDLDNAEQITEWQAKKSGKYIKIKSEKNVQIKLKLAGPTRQEDVYEGYIQWTELYEISKQGRLF